jgi:hypothetical protein
MSFEMYKYLYNRDLKGTYNIKGLKPEQLNGNFNYGIVQFRKMIEDYYED